MSSRKTHPGRAIGLVAVACANLAAAADTRSPVEPRPVRVYTNDDLDRVHPFAGQTGGSSASAVAETPEEAEPEARPRGRGERYWRDEAARVRERLRALEERAAGLRSRLAERSREAPIYGRRGASGSRSSGTASLQASLTALERRIRVTQDDLEERARRDGALPGWLR